MSDHLWSAIFSVIVYSTRFLWCNCVEAQRTPYGAFYETSQTGYNGRFPGKVWSTVFSPKYFKNLSLVLLERTQSMSIFYTFKQTKTQASVEKICQISKTKGKNKDITVVTFSPLVSLYSSLSESSDIFQTGYFSKQRHVQAMPEQEGSTLGPDRRVQMYWKMG